MAYIIVDRDGCYFDTTSYHGNERILHLFDDRKMAQTHIDLYYERRGFKTRYLKTHSEKLETKS